MVFLNLIPFVKTWQYFVRLKYGKYKPKGKLHLCLVNFIVESPQILCFKNPAMLFFFCIYRKIDVPITLPKLARQITSNSWLLC